MRKRRTLAAILTTLLASLLSYALAAYIYYPWPEKFALSCSLIALSFFVAVQRPVRKWRLVLRIPRAITSLALMLGFLTLVIANVVPSPQLALSLALVYGALVTGVSLAEILELRSVFEGLLGFLVLSFIIGATYLGAVALAASLFLGFPASRYTVLFLAALHTSHLIGISLKDENQASVVVVNVDDLLLACLWLAILYNFFSLYYINDVYLPGEDILRHFMFSVNLIRNPWKYLSLSPDHYLLFHSFEGGLMLLANCYDAPLLNSAILPVGILCTLALAQLATNAFESPVSRRIALLYPLIFSGLGWLYLLLGRPASSAAYFTALAAGSEKVYRNLIYMPFPLMWPTSQALSVAAFLLFLALLLKAVKLQVAPPRAAIAAGILMFSMLSMHPPQGAVAAVLLVLLVLLWGRNFSRALKPVSLGTAAGALAGGVLNMVAVLLALQEVPRLQSLLLLRVATFFAPVLAATTAFVLSSLGIGLDPLLARSADRLRVQAPVATALGIFLLLLGVLVAFDPSNTFATSRADPGGVVGVVPWFIYSVLLGAALPLGLRGFELLASEGSRAQVVMFSLLGVLAVATGRVSSFLNVSGIDAGYWGEKRFILFVYIALAPPAIYTLERLARGKPLRAVALSILVAVLAANALVCASYWGILSERVRIDSAEKAAFDRLSQLFWENPNRWILSPTLRSRDASAFAAPIYYVFSDPSRAWRWQAPELSLSAVRSRNLDPPYLYVNWATDAQPASSGWMGRILLSRLPKVFSIDAIDVYDAPPLAPPLPNGRVALVIPPVWDERVDEAYLLLSLAGVNYTSVLEIDPTLYDYKVIVVPYDPLVESRTVNIDLLKAPIVLTSGAVRVGTNSIELGSRSERPGNIIVWRNPFYLLPEAFNVTLRFMVKDFNPNVLNYFSFIYDFQDVGNYKYVSIVFIGQKQLYALSCSLRDGNYTCSPTWPGVPIGNVTNMVGEHIVEVSANNLEGRLCLSFDSLNTVCFTANFTNGFMGVRVDRFWALEIKSAFLKVRARNYMCMECLAAGNSTLVVLEKGFSGLRETEVRGINIVYVNFPESQMLLNGSVFSSLFYKVSDEFKNANFNTTKYYSEISYSNLAANKIIFNNVTIISSNFLIIPKGLLRASKLNASSPTTIHALYLVLKDPLNRPLKGFLNHTVTIAGLGYYVMFKAKELYVPGAQIYAYFSNGSSAELGSDVILQGELLILARRPTFTAYQALIEGVVGQSFLYPYLPRNLSVHGYSSFNFMVGDSSSLYFIVNPEDSKIVLNPSLNLYSDWESIPLILKHLPLSIVISLFLLKGDIYKRKKLKYNINNYDH